jgi:hypothetical protein
MQYMRDRQAQFTPLQQQSFENAGLMQTAPQLGDATAMAGMAGLGALNTQYTFNPYQTQQFTGNTLPGTMQPVSYPACLALHAWNVVGAPATDAHSSSRLLQDKHSKHKLLVPVHLAAVVTILCVVRPQVT